MAKAQMIFGVILAIIASCLVIGGFSRLVEGNDPIAFLFFIIAAPLVLLGVGLAIAGRKLNVAANDRARVSRGEMKVCPHCDNLVLTSVNTCPNCDADISQVVPRLADIERIQERTRAQQNKGRDRAFIIAAASVVVVPIVVVLVVFVVLLFR
jgi:hypothetical protein